MSKYLSTNYDNKNTIEKQVVLNDHELTNNSNEVLKIKLEKKVSYNSWR